MRVWICLAVFTMLFLVTPASAEWNEQTLLESDTYMQVFGVSDDGSKIVYIADTDGNDVTGWDREVFLMDLNTGEVTRITRNVDQEVQAGISGDGNVIVYGTVTRVGGETVVKYYEVRGDEGWQTPRPLMRGDSEFMQDMDELPVLTDEAVLPIIDINHDGRSVVVANIYSCLYYFSNRQFTGEASHYRRAEFGGNHLVLHWRVYEDEERKENLIDKLVMFDPTNLNMPLNTIFTGYDEVISRFDVSSDGKVVFYVFPYPLAEPSERQGLRRGIFLYDGMDTFLIRPDPDVFERKAPYVGISGDGSKVFYSTFMELRVMNSDGSNDSLVHDVDIEYGDAYIYPNSDGSKVLYWFATGTAPHHYGLKLYTPLESTSTFNRVQGIIPNIHSSWLANSGVFIPPATTIEFGSAEGTPGSEIQIPVTIRNAENIGAINLVLSYPTDVLEFEELLAGSLTQNSMIEHNVQDGNINVGIVDTEGISGDGSLFYLKLRVIGVVEKVINATVEGIEWVKKGGTRVGSLTPALTERSANSTLAILEAIVNDVDGNEVEVVTIDGNFNLISEEEVRKGDVNGDGVINSLDALLALQMSVGKLKPNMIADMNDDGKILANDALEILKLANENMISSSAIQMAQQLGKGFKPGMHEVGK